MNKQRNLHNILQRFHENLQIPRKDKSALQAARRNVRSHLRQKFGEIKFMTQGSYAYHTLNRPNHVPPQRMDLDDGAYFSHLKITGGNAGYVSAGLFNAVDQALEELANRHDWRLDTSKPSCSRLIICDDKHIDVPCYFVMSGHLSEEASSHQSSYYSLYKDANIAYHGLAGPILLAHREKGWIESDPMRIIDWVLECVERYGQQFLRVCCYFKAWRDHQWKKSPMKSLIIMAMVERAFEDGRISKGEVEDDAAVFKVAGRIIDYVDGCIKDPSDDSHCLDENLAPEDRQAIIERLTELHSVMEKVLYDSNIDARTACRIMCEQFGRWFPNDSSLILPLAVVAPAIISAPTPVTANRAWAK